MLTRKQAKQRKQAKAREASASARLCKQLGRTPDGRALAAKRQDRELTVVYLRIEKEPVYKSLAGSAQTDRELAFDFEYEGHGERNAIAQIEIERKKLRVAPLYNKGGLQYITDDADLTTLGRKV